jgi:DNA-binding transcriptional LysR family regulator
MADDLEGISVFLTLAEARNFRVAGERLGVTRSAVSQALQRLEIGSAWPWFSARPAVFV